MSDSEKKTEEKAESARVDKAPHLKNDSQQKNTSDSSRSNFVIPLVLLLVAAIVIISTFYEDEYKDLVAKTDPATNSQGGPSSTDDSAKTEIAIIEPVSKEPSPEQQTVSTTTTSTTKTQNETEAVTQAAEAGIASANQSAAASKSNPSTAGLAKKASTVNPAAIEETASTSDQMSAQSRDTQQQHRPFASRQDYEKAREEAMAHARAQAKKHNELMQQRRQAYEKEMQERRENLKSAMKAYRDKREKIAEAQKAIYQQFEQNRIETIQKMEELQKEIAEMNKQMYQMMRQSRPLRKRDPLAPMTRPPQPQFRYNSATPNQETRTEQMNNI